MTEHDRAFDTDRLDRRFREATRLPGAEPGDRNWWDLWRRHLADRKAPRWHCSPGSAKRFAANWPALTARWREAAEELRADPRNAGFRPARLPNGDIDWGANPSKSMNWAGMHYWSWANPLVRGYALSGDEKFAEAFSDHLRSYFEQVGSFVPDLWQGASKADLRTPADWRDWITHNDLSAGLKMMAFSEATMVFARSSAWGAEDMRRATLLMAWLAERLYGAYRDATNPADFLRTRNFLTAGAAGLGAVAVVLPECNWSKPWRSLAVRILETHVMDIYYSDGGHKELCTQYHKTGLRDVLFFEQALAANGESCFLTREPYRTRILRALHWLTGILMPDGSTAVLNSAAASNDWLVYGLVANKILQDHELGWHLDRWYSADYVPRQKAIPADSRILGDGDVPGGPTRKADKCSALFPESGVAVLRNGWSRWASVMALDFGRPIGGHAYPALGSFSLYLKGKPAALSPGSPHAYTDPDYRGWMHTSRSQNNVWIDELDQEQWESPGVRRVHGEILIWEEGAGSALVRGRHPGYLASIGVLHTRTVKMVGDLFLVHDVLDASSASEDHVAKWSLHCPQPLEARAGRRAVAEGLMQVVPAWPDQVLALEFGHQGKAVMPAASEDGRTDAHQTLYQARWHQDVCAGKVCEFLMAVAPDDGETAIEGVARNADGISVTLRMGGVAGTVRLPAP